MKLLSEEIGRHSHVSNRAEAAHEREGEPPPQPMPSRELPVAIGDQIVQRKIAGHRQHGCEPLPPSEGQGQSAIEQQQHSKVHDHSRPTDQGKGDQSHRHIAADRLVEQEHQVLPHHLAIDLTLPSLPGSEFKGKFLESQ